MYATHQPIIADYAQANADNFARVIQFCILSARVRFFNVPADTETAARGGPESAGVLFGWKARAYADAWAYRDQIYWHCQDIWHHGGPRREKADAIVAYLAGACHGLDLAKGGFVAQLAYGLSGCLDTVNIERLGLRQHPENFKGLRTPRSRRRRAGAYNARVYRLGGTERLWNDWCAEMARRYPTKFPTATDVSAFHLTCLNLV